MKELEIKTFYTGRHVSKNAYGVEEGVTDYICIYGCWWCRCHLTAIFGVDHYGKEQGVFKSKEELLEYFTREEVDSEEEFYSHVAN